MSAKHLTNLVTLTLALDDLGWLRNFLKEERLAAEIDHEEVERLNTDVAIRAAKIALNSEIARLAKVIDALDVAIAADDVREAIAKRIDATVPGMPDISNTHN
ncbi:hypothetical protein QP415_03385 [Pauljensenia sp. UMB3104]|uniref:hypothetical protein n=1 Tax=Pauljensenia sp. UMB3104 TaxID=3046331 RepID=UPI001CB60C22|nr:hypothetical protein [Pauljensenia sp. UMB3104]MBF1139498.1 hypothetical protein [Thermobifida sp.]MDK7158903.1 hypothetical protein [Pauljensenia sp. UMB3104]